VASNEFDWEQLLITVIGAFLSVVGAVMVSKYAIKQEWKKWSISLSVDPVVKMCSAIRNEALRKRRGWKKIERTRIIALSSLPKIDIHCPEEITSTAIKMIEACKGKKPDEEKLKEILTLLGSLETWAKKSLPKKSMRGYFQ